MGIRGYHFVSRSRVAADIEEVRELRPESTTLERGTVVVKASRSQCDA